MKECNIPLVSVPVVTYNSSKTVIETLDSIYNQTYPNIELIVSDDCSTDNTVEICRQWIEQHKERFVRVELLTSEKNTGVAGNGNRAEAVCRGEWCKGIAGDDILLPNCIQDCIEYVTEHPETIWLFGRIKAFGENTELIDYFNHRFNTNQAFYELSKEDQHRSLIVDGNNIPAPTAFVNVKKNRVIEGQNDEHIPLLEDYPKWLNLTTKTKLYWLDIPLVAYRIHEGALSNNGNFSSAFKESNATFYLLYIYPELKKIKPALAIKHYIFNQEILHQNKGVWHFLGHIGRVYEKFIRNIIKK